MVFTTGLLNYLPFNEGRTCGLRRLNWGPRLFRQVTEAPKWA